MVEAVVALGDRAGVEGVRLDHVRPGREEGIVDLAHRVGDGEVQHVVVSGERMPVRVEAPAAVVGLAEPVALDHRAHGPVEEHDAARRESPQRRLVGPMRAHGASAADSPPIGRGRSPRMWQIEATSSARLRV